MNNLVLLQDSNWLLMSRLFSLESQFNIGNPAHVIEQAGKDLQELLSRSVSKILNQFPEIDGIVMVSDGGSWRKYVPRPDQISDIVYKGQRVKKTELDWGAIYKAFGEWLNHAQSLGITLSTHSAVEGDDWIWYWSRKLNEQGISTLIWSSDCDLKQLVQTNGSAFTAWYNDKVGLVLPDTCLSSDDPLEYMMGTTFRSAVLDSLIRHCKRSGYINPDSIVINKVLCGDAGDNIKPCARFTKGSRVYKFTDKDYNELMNTMELNYISDLRSGTHKISNWISNHKKFKPYNIDPEQIREMLAFNLRLVWLNEEVLPSTVLNAMCAFDYKDYNINEVRRNYKTLLIPDTTIADIFEEAMEQNIEFSDELPF